MMEKEKLSLIRCHDCGDKFKADDIVYTVSARKWSDYSCEFEGLSLVENIDGTTLCIDREINFHQKCWDNIAGAKYMP